MCCGNNVASLQEMRKSDVSNDIVAFLLADPGFVSLTLTSFDHSICIFFASEIRAYRLRLINHLLSSICVLCAACLDEDLCGSSFNFSHFRPPLLVFSHLQMLSKIAEGDSASKWDVQFEATAFIATLRKATSARLRALFDSKSLLFQ